MSLSVRDHPSPNHDARPAPPDLVVLHYTGMQDLETALARLTDPKPQAGRYPGPWQSEAIDPLAPLARVSAHYVIAEDGGVFRLVEEDRRAWHAGVSAWAGRTGLNDTAIGIEIVNGGHDFGLPPFPAAQVKAVEELVIDILRRRGLGPHRVVGHSDIAPDRKQDPGERFPWRALAEAGAALWPLGSARADRGPAFGPGEAGEAVMAVQEALAGFGYGVDVTGVFDASTEAAMRAFQRRFRPDRIDGRADPECLAILADLLGQLSRLALPRLRS